MDRKERCESIVLKKSEKELLVNIARNPHTACDWLTARPLILMDLISEDTCGENSFGEPIGIGTYCTSEFYDVYVSHKRERRFEQLLQSLWLPALVSVITTLTVNGLQAWLPMLLQWFSNFHR